MSEIGGRSVFSADLDQMHSTGAVRWEVSFPAGTKAEVVNEADARIRGAIESAALGAGAGRVVGLHGRGPAGGLSKLWGDERRTERDHRSESFTNLDVFQDEVKEWAYRNFGSPDDGRTIRSKRALDMIEGMCRDGMLSPEAVLPVVDNVRSAPPDAPSYRPLLGAVEELGELAHAHLKGEQGIRHTPEEIADKKRDAVGDVLVYLADYCNREGVEMSACVERAWGEVKRRDWRKQTGMDQVEEPELDRADARALQSRAEYLADKEDAFERGEEIT